MRAAVATRFDVDNPLAGLEVRDLETPPTPGWARVHVRAASFNHHDIWTLRGLSGHRVDPPLVLGTDAAGVTDDGQEVIVHAVVAPGLLLSERAPGTLADRVFAPAENLIPKPAELSFAEAACLPTSYLTAFNMLFGKARLIPGEHVLIQGAGGGVSTAAVLLATAAGLEVTVTSRDEERLRRARELGAHHAIVTGQQLSDRVDAVLETVGAATWAHSLRSVRPGGRIVVAGATTGFDPSAELPHLFLRDVDVLGTFMGSPEQLGLLANMLATTGVRPLIDSVRPLDDITEAAERMVAGKAFGKLVVEIS
ncbi:zinc-binding dehydrogenase [Streptomyces sp. NPDC047081]|uniref:zinc-binding dehydrogenase n=1 Tax=Streptomyces sp. NPDC047081 TaxID=3154706 RepID=UPI003405CD25